MECDVNGLSYLQVADKHHTSPEVIKRRRQKAYSKILDAIKYEKSQGH